MIDLTHELTVDSYYIEVLEQYAEQRKSLPKEYKISELQDIILDNYIWTPPTMVLIPKSDNKSFREIYMFEDMDSFFQKVINNILNKNFRKDIHKNVYSYLKGVRTYDAAKHVQYKLKEGTLYGAKADISNYFLSVDKHIIHSCVDKLIVDDYGKNLLKQLFSINTYYHKKEQHTKYLSLMPGSATSAFFANYILKDVDKILEETTTVFARYSDDIIFFCETSNEVPRVIDIINVELSKLGLRLNPKKVHLLDSSTPIDFLGLEITSKYIDINKQTFRNTKAFIKKICREARIKVERAKKKRDIHAVEQCIKRLNKLLYKQILINRADHKSGRASYIFSNITTGKTIREIDFYMRDQLRFVYTGKHNKGNIKYLPNELLAEFGLISMGDLYHLYKMDKDVYKNEVSLLNFEDSKPYNFYISESLDIASNKRFIPYETDKYFSEIYDAILSSEGHFYFDNLKVDPEFVEFDIIDKTISVSNLIIAKGNEMMIDRIKCFINGNYLEVKLNNSTVCGLEKCSIKTLYKLYLRATYKTDYSFERKSNTPFKHRQLFRSYYLNDLLTVYDLKDLNIHTSYYKRYTLFISYLYLQIVSGNLQKEIDCTQKYIKIKLDSFALILKGEWFI